MTHPLEIAQYPDFKCHHKVKEKPVMLGFMVLIMLYEFFKIYFEINESEICLTRCVQQAVW